MPSHVKIFWWLSIVIVIWWVFWTARFLLFPTAHYLAVLAKLPLEFREAARRSDIQTGIISTLVWGGVTLGLAWLAAFRRLNWARWAFGIVFLIREAIPFLVFAAYHQLGHYMTELAHENWTDPVGYLIPAVTLTAIAFVFSGNARGWFTPSTTIA